MGRGRVMAESRAKTEGLIADSMVEILKILTLTDPAEQAKALAVVDDRRTFVSCSCASLALTA
eukprot:1389880-Pyramimonas_sp.AAC.2